MKLSGTKLLPVLLTLLLGACSTTGGETAAQADPGANAETGAPAETSADPAASTEAGEQAGEEVAAAPVFDPIKCKKMRPTGTRIPIKVCKKQSEWDAIREGSQKAGEDIQRRAAHQNTTL